MFRFYLRTGRRTGISTPLWFAVLFAAPAYLLGAMLVAMWLLFVWLCKAIKWISLRLKDVARDGWPPLKAWLYNQIERQRRAAANTEGTHHEP